jgi:hypothetical protein
MPTRCECEHTSHDEEGGCGRDASVTRTFDGEDAALCLECDAADHMGDPDEEGPA